MESCGWTTSGEGGLHHCIGKDNGCVGGTVWGAIVYTSDSNPCSAALHAGVITTKGGDFIVVPRPGLQRYDGTTNNGVASHPYGPWANSFEVFSPQDNAVSANTTATSALASGSAPSSTAAAATLTTIRCGMALDRTWFCKGAINGCLGGAVWGTEESYTADSSVCTAALHAGVIGTGGGSFCVTNRPGRASYESSTKNGVTTRAYGPWPESFVVHRVGEPAPESVMCGQLTANTWMCVGISDGCPGTACWGTDVYTSDSSKCVAARHAGIIGKCGGTFAFTFVGPRVAYTGSTRNGVTTSSYGSWGQSFMVHPIGTKAPVPEFHGAADPVVAPKPTPVRAAEEAPPPSNTPNQPSAPPMATISNRGCRRSADGSISTCIGRRNGCMGGDVYGNGLYSGNSDVCSAALHSGVIGIGGGAFCVVRQPAQQSLVGTLRNGVASRQCGPCQSSFVILPMEEGSSGDIDPSTVSK